MNGGAPERSFERALERPAQRGCRAPMGVTALQVEGRPGLNAVVHAPHARAVWLCLFSPDGRTETQRLRLHDEGDGLWCGFAPGAGVGQLYGLRADGPWAPETGHRYNPARLLLDPWARAVVGSTAALALECDDPDGHGHPPHTPDNAARMPKARVLDLDAELRAGAAIAPGPATPPAHRLIYEAQVKSLTALHPDVPAAQRGTWAGLASAPLLAHYRALGLTALCLLPVQLHLDERHLIERGLTNHWGYNTLNFFAPDPRFATAAARGDDAAVRAEFRAMVDRLHRAGLQVLLDVVYNHTAEGGVQGPTLSWRGLDHAAWYALDAHGHPLNPSGCGNTLQMGNPRVVQLIMDSLRWWVQAFGVDGFRFDLAVALGREPQRQHRFHPMAPLFTAMAQDPVLAQVTCIAEPWDLGPDGYQLGQFAPGWLEWNDRFRDGVRAWWLGHDCSRGEIARRIAGSSERFAHDGRLPLASVNLITAHDGFTLADLTSYRHKHNQANGEHNRDGADVNWSANAGTEGPSDDPAVRTLRAQWRRALLATLLCSQGTPQLLAGDEIGHSQQGNNNAYCQDNPISWLDWSRADTALCHFVAGVSALRRRLPALRHARWFTGEWSAADLPPDIEWRTAEGHPPALSDWELSDGRLLAAVITVGEDGGAPRERVFVLLHAGTHASTVRLPDGAWHTVLDSASGFVQPADAAPAPSADEAPTPWAAPVRGEITVHPPTLRVLLQALPTEPETAP